MELTVRDVVNAWASAKIIANRKLKIQPSFWLARQLKKLQVTYETYDEQNGDLVRKYGDVTPDGKEWKVKPEHDAEYIAEHKALLDAKVQEAIEQKPVSFLGQDDIEAALLLNLWFLFTDEEP